MTLSTVVGDPGYRGLLLKVCLVSGSPVRGPSRPPADTGRVLRVCICVLAPPTPRVPRGSYL